MADQRNASIGSGGGSPRRVGLIFEALRSGGGGGDAAFAAGADSGGGGGQQQQLQQGTVGPAHAAALAAIEKKLARHGDAVLDEYDRICRPSALDETPCTVAEQREHASLNRYFNVLPFDYNRVRLTDADSDYINASLLRSKEGEAPAWSYIATQAPLPATAAHFWACVWHQGSGVVLMLTREVEAGARKCHAYLPPTVGKSVTYGDIAVRLDRAREVDEDISHRALTVSRGGQARRVDHFQYHAWPDHGVPRTTRPLRALARLLEDNGSHAAGPAVVHCSAGIGRTGTFCALDIALRRLRALDPSDAATAEEAVKVKRIVSRLRKQRAGMVQTPDQYLFCYQALKEELEEALAGQEPAGSTGTPLPGHASAPAAATGAARQPPQQPPQQPQQQPRIPNLRGGGGGGSGSGRRHTITAANMPVPLAGRQGSGGGRSSGAHSADEAEPAFRGGESPSSSLSGSSPPRSPSGSLRRRPSGPGGWAGLMGGASTASDPWAALNRAAGGEK